MKLGNFIEGLLILQKYFGEDSYCVMAEHDQIWVGDDETKVSKEDKKDLIKLDWEFDKDVGNWSCYI